MRQNPHIFLIRGNCCSCTNIYLAPSALFIGDSFVLDLIHNMNFDTFCFDFIGLLKMRLLYSEW